MDHSHPDIAHLLQDIKYKIKEFVNVFKGHDIFTLICTDSLLFFGIGSVIWSKKKIDSPCCVAFVEILNPSLLGNII